MTGGRMNGPASFPLEARYAQASGLIYLVDAFDSATLIGRGYSGKGGALNNPDREGEASLGPIPVGVYELGAPVDRRDIGPYAIPLTRTEKDRYGRSGFYIHGDNRVGNFSASSGCIILPRDVRYRLVACNVERLVVIHG